MEPLIRWFGYLLLVATALAWLTLSGWLKMRREWGRPVTFEDYRRFQEAVAKKDKATMREIFTKYGGIGS